MTEIFIDVRSDSKEHQLLHYDDYIWMQAQIQATIKM